MRSAHPLYTYMNYIYILKKKKGEQILLEHRPDDLGSGFIVQVFGGESEEKQKQKTDVSGVC